MPTSWRDLFDRGARYDVELATIQDRGERALERTTAVGDGSSTDDGEAADAQAEHGDTDDERRGGR